MLNDADIKIGENTVVVNVRMKNILDNDAALPIAIRDKIVKYVGKAAHGKQISIVCGESSAVATSSPNRTQTKKSIEGAVAELRHLIVGGSTFLPVNLAQKLAS